MPFAINNRGQIVGQYADAQGLHAYLLDDGVYTTIDPPAGPGTTAADINDRGQIVIPFPGASSSSSGLLAVSNDGPRQHTRVP